MPGELPRYYCAIEDWPGSPMARLAEAEQEIGRLIQDRTRGEQKIAELVERNRHQEATIQRGRSELERLQQEVAQLRAQEAAAPPAPPRKHERKAGETIPCGVEGCTEDLVPGTSMAQHRRRKHAVWYSEQMSMPLSDPRYVSNRGGPLPTVTIVPVAPTPARPPEPTVSPRENQEQMLATQFAALEGRFECSACHTNTHAQSITDKTRCQHCVEIGRFANGVAI